jgi:hypothetical protein
VTKTQQRVHYLQKVGHVPTLAHSSAGSTLVASGGGQDVGRLRLKGSGTFDVVPRQQQREQMEDEMFLEHDQRLEDLKAQV